VVQAQHNAPDAEQLVLAGLFPPADRAAWLALVEQGRRGAPLARLVSHTYDNLAIQPLYTRADWQPEMDPVGLPGMMPFTRGALPAGHVAGGWDVRQSHAHPDLEASHAAILTDLACGVTSLQLRCDAAGRLGLDPDDPAAAALAGVDGLMLYTVDDLETLLRQVRLNDVPLALEPGAQFVPLAAMLMALWQRRGIAAAAARGAFNADPLGVLALAGELPVSVVAMLHQMADLATFTARHYPQVTNIRVDASPYHGAGATEVQELACSLATAVAYVRALTEAGMAIDTACQQLTFSYAVDPDVFVSIAKLRAARRLWARVAEACGATATARRMQLHVQTARRVMSQRDPWVNMLRTTVACFAAAVAGADSITVLPYDAALGLPVDFARRIARNTQLILQEETGVHRVIDPAGGSWYVERLSAELAQAAWTQFQAIEQAGGMAQALQQGMIAEMIATVWAERLQNLARRKDGVTGVSEFPDLDEQPIATVTADVDTLRRLAAERIGQWRTQHDSTAALQKLATQAHATTGALTEAAVAAAQAGATVGAMAQRLRGPAMRIEALSQHRFAEAFEALRDASDAYCATHGARPAVCLINLGTAAQYTARHTFASYFFAAGGIVTSGSNGVMTAQEAVQAVQASGARLAVLCSSDAMYTAQVGAIAPALKQAGVTWLCLAGHPGAQEQAYRQSGIDDFIHLGSDALAVLRTTLIRLGVMQS